MILVTAVLVGLALVLYQQFIFAMAMRYTLSFWLSYTVLLSVLLYLSSAPLPLGAMSLIAVAVSLGELGLIHVTRRLEADSERDPPGSGPLPGEGDEPEPEKHWDRTG